MPYYVSFDLSQTLTAQDKVLYVQAKVLQDFRKQGYLKFMNYQSRLFFFLAMINEK